MSSEEWDRRYSPSDAFRVSAHDSTGKIWQLGWEVHQYGKDRFDDPNSNLSGRKLLFIGLPTAFPPNFKWVDIDVKDKWKRTAKWRLTGLRAAQSTLESPLQMSDTYAKNGIFIRAQAVWDYSQNVPSRERRTTIMIQQEALPSATRRWATEPAGFQPEWIRQSDSVYDGNVRAKTAINFRAEITEKRGAKVGDLSKPNAGYGNTISAFYPEDNRYARVVVLLYEYAENNTPLLQATPISITPIVLTVPIADKGSVEERFPYMRALE